MRGNKLLVLLLGIATFLRLYRINDLLGFWYDQGRDALVIWDLIHKGKFFLIGPTTGIEGVFRGPWYYWLITPFYWIGKGNPLYPSTFLILTSVFAIYVLFKVAEEIGGRNLGYLAALIASISVYIIDASRWLSNPTPMLLIGITLVWSVLRFLKKKIWSVPLMSFLLGMALQFGSAMEVFYLPAVLIILILNRKILPSVKVLILSGGIFLATLLPQIIFDLRHQGIITNAIIQFLKVENNYGTTFLQEVVRHLSIYKDLFFNLFWENGSIAIAPFILVVLIYLIFTFRKLWKDDMYKIIFLLTISPLIGALFFRGAYGNIYSYYFTGYYLIFILFVSYLLIKLTKKWIGKAISTVFILILVFQNANIYIDNYAVSLNDPKIIAFKNQVSAINWIYKDAGNEKFNTDIYVPPVIPYAYDYLFKWKMNDRHVEEKTSLLYTLYEVDPPHPERLSAWLDRQKGIGEIVKEEKFGGIVVQERKRIK